MLNTKKILSFFISLTLITSISLQAFAKENSTSVKTNSKIETLKINSDTTATIDSSDTNTKTIKVYINDKLDQTVVVNNNSGDITLTKSSGDITHDKISNHIKTVDTTKTKMSPTPNISANAVQSSNLVTPLVNYGDGYSLIKDYYSSYYQMNAHLYWKYEKSWRELAKRFSFTAGTAVGVIIGVLVGFVTAPVTITAILIAAGTGVAGGVITNYIDSSVCFEYRRWNYRVRSDSGYLCLTTYRDDKWEVVYNYLNSTESYLNAGWGGGFAGTDTDILEAGCQQYRLTFGW
ncbi:hypothetical protein [Candidatus Clostridium stratigraminis]|uniref:Uncharacterized protein n=1 Tax=Candidatus Clostridium stratigraminis TaxID=3381661 RepID=A0ABW8T7N9_9CLOT